MVTCCSSDSELDACLREGRGVLVPSDILDERVLVFLKLSSGRLYLDSRVVSGIQKWYVWFRDSEGVV